MATRTYLAETWLDPRLVLRRSTIHGRGVFTTDVFVEGEVVLIWGGATWTRWQFDAGEVPPCSYSFVDDDLLLAAPQDGLDYFVNHSCDPSVWMADEVTVVARRRIEAGEELTGDYALWEAEDGHLIEDCRCETTACRGTIRGDDWRLRELQERYAGHFLPYIERRARRSTTG